MTDAQRRLAPFADRVTTRQADATSLPFNDDSFDFVLSWIMLHHVDAQWIVLPFLWRLNSIDGNFVLPPVTEVVVPSQLRLQPR